MSGLREFDVITFDADQTLIDFRPAMRDALDASLDQLKRTIPAAEELAVEDLIRVRMRRRNGSVRQRRWKRSDSRRSRPRSHTLAPMSREHRKVTTTNPAVSKTCGDRVVADARDNGRVDLIYPIRCYQLAIDLLPDPRRNQAGSVLCSLSPGWEDAPD